MEWFRAANTFLGFLEGSQAVISKRIRETLKERLLHTNGQRFVDALHICDSGAEVLPACRCEASLVCYTPINKVEDYSRLSLCWFVDEIEGTPQTMVENLMVELDWESIAVDGSWDNI